MNYQGMVNWLQEDGFVVLGFSPAGDSVMMERESRREVNDIPAFLVATVLPVAKRKVVQQLRAQGAIAVRFTEQIDLLGWVVKIMTLTDGADNWSTWAVGGGETGDLAMALAIEMHVKLIQSGNKIL